MLLNFLDELRKAGLRVGLREHLVLLDALERDVIARSPESFYYLARAIFVKDETLIDRFDLAFSKIFKGITASDGADAVAVPADWLHRIAERHLSAEERARIAAPGDWNMLMDMLRQRLAEQEGRHEGGSKWIGTGGTSPFGNGGYHPEGVRIGGESRHGRAVKVWEKREYRNLDNDRELGVRNMQVALRRLRRFARDGAADELDLDATIAGTARQGWLDLRMRPRRRNAVRLLLFLDIGGSMDAHVRLCETLFSAATAEFRHLEFFYFHNCVYEGVWTDNRRRFDERVPTLEILNRYGPDHRLLFVGDAAMSPYEIEMPGGSIEHANAEAGSVWIERLTRAYPAAAWLNPAPRPQWDYAQSTGMLRRLMQDRMYPLTPAGLDDAMHALTRHR